MLINGDLVRIPQGVVVTKMQSSFPQPISVVANPTIGIVLEAKNDEYEDMVKVLLNYEVVYVDNRSLQLVGNK